MLNYDEIKFMLERLNDAFEENTGISLTKSEKAAEYIMRHKNDSLGKISSRFLRDHWPNGAKGNKKEGSEPVERKDKKLSEFKSSKTINKLDLIADCAGYSSWEAFVNITKRKIVTENTFYDPKNFNVKKMSPGDVVTIGWYPQYYIKLKYVGNYKFEVLSQSYNLRHEYNVGDELEIHGVTVRYAYEVCADVDVRQKGKDEEKTSPNQVVSGCPLYPELRIIKREYSESEVEDNISAFVINS